MKNLAAKPDHSQKVNSTVVLGFDLFIGDLSDLVSKTLNGSSSTVINTLNPYSYLISRRDPEFRKALLESDVLIADGIGIVIAGKWLRKLKVPHYTGFQLFTEAMKVVNDMKGRVLFIGATDSTLAKIVENAEVMFPSVTCFTYSPPFKEEFDYSDLNDIRVIIDNAKCDIVFFGLTAPKQEKLMFQVASFEGVKLSAGIGAVFDYFASPSHAPSSWVRARGVEWMWRSLKSRRLLTRNLYTVPRFLLLLTCHKLGFFKE